LETVASRTVFMRELFSRPRCKMREGTDSLWTSKYRQSYGWNCSLCLCSCKARLCQNKMLRKMLGKRRKLH